MGATDGVGGPHESCPTRGGAWWHSVVFPGADPRAEGGEGCHCVDVHPRGHRPGRRRRGGRRPLSGGEELVPVQQQIHPPQLVGEHLRRRAAHPVLERVEPGGGDVVELGDEQLGALADLRDELLMTSQDTGGVGLPVGELLRPVGGGRPGRRGGCRRRLGALHEGWVLLDEGWGYWG